MKKALALILALVLALSMAVSAFALDLVLLEKVEEEDDEIITIKVVDESEATLLTYEGGKFYIALEDKAWEDIELTANGNVTAELVEYDPETMEIDGIRVHFNVVNYKVKDANGDPTVLETIANESDVKAYEAALGLAAKYNKEGVNGGADKVTYYGVEVLTNVNIIKLVVEDNYTAHYTEGTVKVEATLDDEDYAGTIKVINDVVNFEYEQVKWTADNFNAKLAKSAYLEVNEDGYSDYVAAQTGYDVDDAAYNEAENRVADLAAVVSTTAFRALEGEDLRVVANNKLNVALYDIVKGQKGVNFQYYTTLDFEDDVIENDVRDNNEDVNAIEFGFLGDQVVKGAFEITYNTGYDWFELRELFGLKVEEDDIISYYLVDANGKVVGGKEVDYMTADLDEIAVFTVKGENQKLGEYKIVLEVPAAESGEANPNTGAESVVGVVAALAVVSVATAAAVSLKK